MTTPGQPLDLPADLWAIVFAASRSAEKAALRQVCSSAREGAFIACQSAVIWDLRTRDASGDPTRPEMLRLARRMPSLRSVYFVFHTRQAFLEAVDALSAVAAERRMRLCGSGYVGSGHVGDGTRRWTHCTSLARLRWEAKEEGRRQCRAYVEFVEA